MLPVVARQINVIQIGRHPVTAGGVTGQEYILSDIAGLEVDVVLTFAQGHLVLVEHIHVFFLIS